MRRILIAPRIKHHKPNPPNPVYKTYDHRF